MPRYLSALALLIALLVPAPAAANRTVRAVSMQGKDGYAPPPDTHDGAYFTTHDGCTYRRAQAPGYRPTWHLVLNPHHLGRPKAHRRCPGSLRN